MGHILITRGVAKTGKQWIEMWAAMNIPIENQSLVIEAILRFVIRHKVEGFGRIFADLIMNHRAKTKAIENGFAEVLQGGRDTQGIIPVIFFVIIPKSPTTNWGWARIGWSWTVWWQFFNNILNSLESSAAFDTLAALLDLVEAESGEPLKQQQMWDVKRLATVRAALCKFGGIDNEADLVACTDATLF